MPIKLFDSELKVMDVLWKEGDLTVKRIAGILGELVGWNKNTTYTVIKKCVEKGAIERREPNFFCHAIVTKEQAREYELDELIGKLFEGSSDLLFASLLERKNLPAHTLEKLKSMVGDAKETGT